MNCLLQSLGLVASLCFTSVLSHGGFRDMMPNGYNVPDPCHAGATWQAFGHHAMNAGGALNAFGRDFRNMGSNQWTRAVCLADSDGDGKTNGEELGDPHCTWMRGDTAPSDPIGHPGVCEPVNSLKCKENNCPWLACGCDDLVTLNVCVKEETEGHTVRVSDQHNDSAIVSHDRVSLPSRFPRSIVRRFRITEEERCHQIHVHMTSVPNLSTNILSLLPSDFLPFGTHCTALHSSSSLCDLLTR